MARWLRCVAQSTVVLSVLLSVASPTHSQDEAGDPARVIKALALVSGERVAEVGAGDGALTVAIARHVGPDGRVFTTELGESRVRSLQAAVTASGLAQIEVVEAATTHTNLGDACCDALLMRDVYHHFADSRRQMEKRAPPLRGDPAMAVMELDARRFHGNWQTPGSPWCRATRSAAAASWWWRDGPSGYFLRVPGLGGTRAPFSRASLIPMAIAWAGR
jgi:hypothetical protein